MSAPAVRHFLDLVDISPQALRGILATGQAMKKQPAKSTLALEGRTLAMIFDKPSTRTRVGVRADGRLARASFPSNLDSEVPPPRAGNVAASKA